MNDGIDVRQARGPSLGCSDIAGNWRCAKLGEFCGGDVGPRQGPDLVPTFDELSHNGRADRACSAENENAQGSCLPRSSRRLAHPLLCPGSNAMSDAALQRERKNRLERKRLKEIFSQFGLV
jgi:hypothetical protein